VPIRVIKYIAHSCALGDLNIFVNCIRITGGTHQPLWTMSAYSALQVRPQTWQSGPPSALIATLEVIQRVEPSNARSVLLEPAVRPTQASVKTAGLAGRHRQAAARRALPALQVPTHRLCARHLAKLVLLGVLKRLQGNRIVCHARRADLLRLLAKKRAQTVLQVVRTKMQLSF